MEFTSETIKQTVIVTSTSRKRKLENDADDYSGGIESELGKSMSSSTKKHTLDSDDEEENDDDYNRKKYDVMQEDDIEGQEDGTEEFDGETKITPFNMKDELEEGYFDKNGMYIWNKNDGEIKDSWLDSVDWMQVKKADEGQQNKPTTNTNDDDESSSDEETFTGDPTELYKQVLVYLKPGESILKAIKRLGGGKQLSASERLKLKKLQKSGKAPVAPTLTEEDKLDKEKMEKLTELADKIMTLTGNMDVYSDTYESLAFKITKNLQPVTKPPPKPVPADDDGLDMFGDEYESKPGSSTMSEPPSAAASSSSS